MLDTPANLLACSLMAAPGLAGGFAIGAARSGHKTFGIEHNGKSFTVRALGVYGWEIRTGCVYSHGTASLSRGTLEESSDLAGLPIDLDATTVVSVVFSAGQAASLIASGSQVLTGADRTGVADSTAAFKSLADLCIPVGARQVWPGGRYKVSGPITSDSYATGSLHIECDGDVTIEVDPACAAFSKLIACYTTAINNSTISGGRLTLELSNKCANGIYLRHAGTDGGYVDWGKVTVKNAKNVMLDGLGQPLVEENQALLVYGRYTSVSICRPIVDGVDRLRNPNGACKGISVSEVVGLVTITDPWVARVMAGPGASQDADGIAVFGYDSAGNPSLYAKREGQLVITNPVIIDCQGRSIKTQISESTITSPRIYRKGVVAFATADIDHQVGGVHVITDPSFDWRKNGATSPVPIGFYAISMQARSSTSENRFTVRGGTLLSAVSVTRAVFVTIGATALDISVSVEGMEAIAVDGLATALYSSGFVEFYGNQVEAATGNTHFRLHGNRMAQGGGALLAMSGNTLANASKLSVDLVGNVNTGADNTANKVLSQLSGTVVTQMRSLLTRDNTGFTDYRGTWVFDTQTLPVGTKFTYDRASSTVTNGPTIAAGTYVDVECLGAMTATTRKVRMTVANGATMDEHYTQTGTWGAIK